MKKKNNTKTSKRFLKENQNVHTRVYPEVSGLAAWSEN
jgi:hypothetical protein